MATGVAMAVAFAYSYEYSTSNMVDFSFIVSLYVSDLLNVTIVLVQYQRWPALYEYSYGSSTSTDYTVHYGTVESTVALRTRIITVITGDDGSLLPSVLHMWQQHLILRV